MKIVNNLSNIMKQFEDEIRKASEEISIGELANIQSNTPVKTGDLKRSIGTNVNSNGDSTEISWGSNLVYAPKVEFENTSYIRDTLKSDKDNIENIIKEHVKNLE